MISNDAFPKNSQNVNASASPEVQENENARSADWIFVYAHDPVNTDGLNFYWLGGRWAGFAVAAGTVALTDASANYLVASRADGSVSVSTATTNWNDTASYARIYKLTTAGGIISSVEDHRAGGFGIHAGVPPAFLAPRVASSASSATPTPNADTTDVYILTALAAAATFGAPTGTPVQGQPLLIRIKDDGVSARALAFNAIYRALGVTLPSTTVLGKTLYIGALYNSTDTKWDVVSVLQEA